MNNYIEIHPEELEQYVITHPEQTASEIAKHFGCSRSTIQNRIQQHGIQKISLDEKEKLTKYIEKHPYHTVEEVALDFGCSVTAMRIKLEQLGFPMKSINNLLEEIYRKELAQYIAEYPYQSLEEIAMAFGCSSKIISQKIQEYGILRESKKIEKIEISIEELEQYIAEYPEDSLEKIAQVFGCSESVIRRNIQKYGITRKNLPSVPPNTRKINISKKELKRYIANHPEDSLEKIAEAFECSETTIYNKIQEYGIQIVPATLKNQFTVAMKRYGICRDSFKKKKLNRYIKIHPEKTVSEIAEIFDYPLEMIEIYFEIVNFKKKDLDHMKRIENNEETEYFM